MILKLLGIILVVLACLYLIINLILVLVKTRKSVRQDTSTIKERKVEIEDEFKEEKSRLADFAFNEFLRQGSDYFRLTKDVKWVYFEKLDREIRAEFVILTDVGSFTFRCEQGSVFKVGSTKKKHFKG